VPAASAFLCSREMRSFLEIGMLDDVCVCCCGSVGVWVVGVGGKLSKKVAG
jgi:hypothetical protein